jgi:hypothetical protein
VLDQSDFREEADATVALAGPLPDGVRDLVKMLEAGDGGSAAAIERSIGCLAPPTGRSLCAQQRMPETSTMLTQSMCCAQSQELIMERSRTILLVDDDPSCWKSSRMSAAALPDPDCDARCKA